MYYIDNMEQFFAMCNFNDTPKEDKIKVSKNGKKKIFPGKRGNELTVKEHRKKPKIISKQLLVMEKNNPEQDQVKFTNSIFEVHSLVHSLIQFQFFRFLPSSRSARPCYVIIPNERYRTPCVPQCTWNIL